MSWAVAGAVIGLGSLPEVNEDALLIVGVASIVFPLCAALAAILLRRGSDRLAGLLLVASAATPTYFAYALNIPALVVGLMLIAAPTLLLRRSGEQF